jgi:hypothetical protein
MAFSKAIAADGTVDPNEALKLRFFTDAAHSQQVGTTLNITINEPTRRHSHRWKRHHHRHSCG